MCQKPRKMYKGTAMYSLIDKQKHVENEKLCLMVNYGA